MRFLLFLLFLLFLFVAQISVLPHFLILGFSFSVMLISAFIFAFLVVDYKELMIFSFSSGFLLDVYSGIPFGIILLSFVLSVILVNFLAYNFLGRENIFVVCIGSAIGFLAYYLIYFSISGLYDLFNFSPEIGTGVALFSRAAIFSIILNTLWVAVLYVPLKKFISFADNLKR